MSSRSLNRVQLIGNLTRDVELRYTPSGTAVATIGLATNRAWTDGTGQKQEETEFHRLVAWAKLAELCSQLLFKGRKVYVEGRLQTRKWQGQDGADRYTTEIVISDMIILDSKRKDGQEYEEDFPMTDVAGMPEDLPIVDEVAEPAKEDKKVKTVVETDEVKADDIPF